jgi:hypothetical protein
MGCLPCLVQSKTYLQARTNIDRIAPRQKCIAAPAQEQVLLVGLGNDEAHTPLETAPFEHVSSIVILHSMPETMCFHPVTNVRLISTLQEKFSSPG